MRALTLVATTAMTWALLTVPAWAEVSDKEASIAEIWIATSIFVSTAILIAWWRLWAGLLLWLFGIFWSIGPVMEWRDPYVGPAIAREMGANYGLHAYAALAAAVILPALMLINRRQKS